MQSEQMAETVDAIKHRHRERCYAMEQRKRADLALGSFLRTACGWRKDGDTATNDTARALAAALMDLGEAKVRLRELEAKRAGAGLRGHDKTAFTRLTTAVGEVAADLTERYAELGSIVEASVLARVPFDKIEADATEAMEALAETLPAWESWGKGVRGFSTRALATIVGEAGDLSSYPKKGHLWKRMGVGLVDGKRQGSPGVAASAAEWTRHGYSAKRRSRLYVIGDSQVKAGDHYRQIYLDRKVYERARAEAAGLQVVPAAKIPKRQADKFMSDGHVHKRAQRYMEKRLLKDLWQAWRQGLPTGAERSLKTCPAADQSAAAAA